MKKIICAVLLLVTCLLAFTGCAEENLGGYLENYENRRPVPVEEITLNFYIICGDKTTENAKKTVALRLSQYTEEKFNTKLNVFYLKASEYASVITQKTAKSYKEADRPDIVLINSKPLFDTLYGAKQLVNLTPYFAGDLYGKLNVSINSAILEASQVQEIVTDAKGNPVKDEKTGKDKIEDRFYCVPNNHVVGEYEYVLVDIATAKHYYKYQNLSTYTSAEAVKELVDTIKGDEALKAQYRSELEATVAPDALDAAVDAKVDEYISEKIKTDVKGKYEDKAEYEKQGYYCNISVMPTATAEDSFSSAFAIVEGTRDQLLNKKYADRSMQIIYAINTVKSFRNLLQYGVFGPNYSLDNKDYVLRENEGINVYDMKLEYTGSIFDAYFCDELDWNEDVSANGLKQNDDAVVAADGE